MLQPARHRSFQLKGLLILLFQFISPCVWAATVVIDLDRNTPGIQSTLTLPPSPDTALVQGAVVVRGNETSFVGSNVASIQVLDTVSGGETLDVDESSLAPGELTSALTPDAVLTPNLFRWADSLPTAEAIGSDGVLTLFRFDLTLKNLSNKADGDLLEFFFVNSEDDASLGTQIDGFNFSYGTGGDNPPIPSEGALIQVQNAPTPTSSRTPTPTWTMLQGPTPTLPIVDDPRVVIDLDRNTGGIQDTLLLPAMPDTASIHGSVVLLADPSAFVGASVIQITVLDTISGSTANNPNLSTLTNGDLSGPIPGSGRVRQSDFHWGNVFVDATVIGADGFLTLFNFDLELINLSNKADGDIYEFSFVTSKDNPVLGIYINGSNFSYGEGGENPPVDQAGAQIYISDNPLPTRTPTATRTLTPTRTPTATDTLTPRPTRTPSPIGRPEPAVVIDLDDELPGIQDELWLPDSPDLATIRGSVKVIGKPLDRVAGNNTQILIMDSISASDTLVVEESSVVAGEQGSVVPPSGHVHEDGIQWVNTLAHTEVLGEDGALTLFSFNLRLKNLTSKADGDVYVFQFRDSQSNETLGIIINNTNYSYGPGGENPQITANSARILIGESIRPSATPTPTPPCDDTGYYLLTSFGDHIHAGDPPRINGSLFTPGMKLFGDAETVLVSESGKGSAPELDLAIMDRFGVVTFVESQGQPPADFILIEPFSCGQAVDLEVSPDGTAFWVLTEGGGIYRGGAAKPGAEPSLLENDADDLCGVFPLDFGDLRDPNFAVQDDPATIRMVGLTVLQTANPEAPTGFISLDSQGGTYLYDGQGRSIRDSQGTPGEGDPGQGLLDPNLVYPFFPGLDIARDIELSRTLDGLAIYDGWGGTHPVPINDPANSVFFLGNRNESGDLLTTVGLPYLIAAFDDPETPLVEVEPLDVHSIFIDLEFCQTGGPGIYVMDRFGGVFTFGNTRVSPNSTTPRFGGPYFFPRLWAEDMEPAGETEF